MINLLRKLLGSNQNNSIRKLDGSPYMGIALYKATNGTVVEVKTFGHIDYISNLYIVPEDGDVLKTVNDAIVTEMLTRK